jgi:hypothetical protein
MRRTLAAAALVAVAVLVAGNAGYASSTHRTSATRAHAVIDAKDSSKNRFLLTFDHKETLAANSKVRDASGHMHSGKVLVEAGGSLKVGKGFKRHGAIFPKLCHHCGRAIIELADKPGIDPLGHAFSYGAALKVGAPQARRGQNVVQKGYFNQDGGQWKLQLHSGGVPSCVVFGSKGRVRVDGKKSVANGRWHQVRCTRTPTKVSLTVDGKVVASVEGPTGFISNVSPVRVGGKKVSPQNKQFHGRLDSVFMKLLTAA